MVVTPCWPSPQKTLLTDFNAWWMRQLVSSLAPESSTAAWRVCFTLNYTGWTSLNESSINWEWWSTCTYKARRHSTWSTAAFLHQTLPVVSVSDLPLAISWSYHVIVAVGSDVGHSPWQVRRPGTCYLIISVIHRSASDLFDQHWRHSFSQCSGTRSAVEALCVMRYTNRQSSSSSSSLSSSSSEQLDDVDDNNDDSTETYDVMAVATIYEPSPTTECPEYTWPSSARLLRAVYWWKRKKERKCSSVYWRLPAYPSLLSSLLSNYPTCKFRARYL